MLLNSGANAFNTANTSNSFNSLNNNFVYSTNRSVATGANLSPTVDQLSNTQNTNNSILNSSHQLQSQLVGLSHGSSPLSTHSSTASVHLHDQTTQLSPLSSSNSNNNQIQTIEAMEIDNASNLNVTAAVQQRQSISHHLNNSNSLSSLNNAELNSPHATAMSNNPTSPQSSNNSSANNNCTSPSAVALATHYPHYNVANHTTPHHFLHYSRLSSYYHPEYHLYNLNGYFEPKNLINNNLINNNFIGNNNLFNNEHNLFPSTNVF